MEWIWSLLVVLVTHPSTTKLLTRKNIWIDDGNGCHVMHRWSRFGANEMDESDFRREFIPLFTFQCTVELLFFSEAIGKKPRKHNAEFSVGIKRKEATFCIAVLGKADVRRKYYHVRTQEFLFRVWKCVLSV